MLLEPYSSDLLSCSACHDQCLFATPEVFARRRQTYATSRKALLLQAVRNDRLTLDKTVVDVLYSALSSGLQHEVCVHRSASGVWPDETLYVRAARAEVVRARMAPDWAVTLRDRWKASGNPYGLTDDEPTRPGTVVFVLDAATRALQPHVRTDLVAIADHFNCNWGMAAAGSSGFELFDLGFIDEARSAGSALHARIARLRPQVLVSDSPEAVYTMSAIWPQWDLNLDVPIVHSKPLARRAA